MSAFLYAVLSVLVFIAWVEGPRHDILSVVLILLSGGLGVYSFVLAGLTAVGKLR